jgi:two-component system LytT family response regulator
MNLAVIDDSDDARTALMILLKKHLPEANIFEAPDVESGLTIIRKVNPEIIFLDVMMPDGSGFDLLGKISNPTFKVVFVSGYDKFALQAFKFSAVDYLVKPVIEHELKDTLARLAKAISQQSMNLMLSALQLNADSRKARKQLVLRDIDNVYVVDVNEIIRCQSTDSYTTFYILNQKPIIVSKQLKEYEELL